MSKFRLIWWTLLLSLPFSLCAQPTRIRGKVADSTSGEGIPYAIVYFDGTFIGASCNNKGLFSIEAESGTDVRFLTAEASGYEPRTVEVTAGTDATLEIRMLRTGEKDEAGRTDSRYVRSILYYLDQSRSRHDPEKASAWEARIYSKVEMALGDADHFLGRKLEKKRESLVPEYIDTTGFGGQIPVLMSEAVLHRYFAQDPAVDKEVFEASRISGLDQQNVIRQFTGTSALRMNFYRDMIPVFSLSVPSPASASANLLYHYTLVDSLLVDGRKTYTIHFEPRKLVTSPTLEGEMDVDAEDHAIRAVRARLSRSANVNWIRTLSVTSENERKEDGTWFYKRENMFLDASAQVNKSWSVAAVQALRNLDYTDVTFGPFPNMNALSGGDKVAVGERPERDSTYWVGARPAPLTRREESIFLAAERFKETPGFKWAKALGSMFVTGYVENTKIGIGYGPWEKTFSFSEMEGFRLQAGFRTTKEFSTKVRLRGLAAYGFGDRMPKWYASTEFILGDNQVRTSRLVFATGQDYERLGRGSGVFTERNIINSLLAPGGFAKQSLMRHAIVEFQHEFSPSVNTTLNFKHFRIFANQDVPLIRPDGTFADSFSANQIHLNGRFSWDERVNRGVFEKTYIFTRYPVISVDLLAGIKGLTSNDCSFYRGELTVDWRVPVGVLGYGNFHINGGAILGSVPYPLLKLHEGNETRFLDKSGFSLMNYYEFASDKWVTAFYEHNFNGLVLGNLPLIKKLNLREVVTFRGAWGTLSEQNRSQAPFVLPEGMSSLEKPYAEAGVGITNIFRLLRVDCFWRLTHRTERPDRNFAVTLGLDLEF